VNALQFKKFLASLFYPFVQKSQKNKNQGFATARSYLIQELKLIFYRKANKLKRVKGVWQSQYLR